MTKPNFEEIVILVKEDNLTEIKRLLEEKVFHPNSPLNGDPIDLDPTDSETFTLATIKHGSMDMIKLLISNGGEVREPAGIVFTPSGRTKVTYERMKTVLPLHQKWLFDYYDSLTSLSSDEKESIHRLIYGSLRLNKTEVEELLSSFPEEVDTYYLSFYAMLRSKALCRAAHCTKSAIYLYEQGAHIHYSADKNALYEAVHYGALYRKTGREDLTLIKFLLENGADANRPMDAKKGYPIEVSISAGFYEITKLLIESGAKLDHSDFTLPLFKHVIDGLTMLEGDGDSNTSEKEEYEKMIPLLFENGCPTETEYIKYPYHNNSIFNYIYSADILELFAPYIDNLSEVSKEVFYEKRLPSLFENK